MAIVILLLFSSSAFLIINFLFKHQWKRRELSLYGCMAAPEVPSNDKLGLSKLYDHLRARTEHRWPSFLAATLDSAGENVHTASHRAVNQNMF